MRMWIAGVGCAAALSASLPVSGFACTMAPFTAILPREFVYFVGTARADTLPVSATDRPVDPLGRPWASRWDPPTFGQSARVSRIGSTLTPERAAELERALVAADSVAILVPWEITAGCQPSPWRRSVRWVTPGAAGLFRGRLRAPSAWVRGVPTLDVFIPSVEPYPSGPTGDPSRAFATRPGPWLTPAELFELYRALPVDSALRRAPEAATMPLRRWAEANSELATRYPAAQMIRQARGAVHYARLRLTALPLAGTYRFTVRLSDGQSFSFYARTEPAPASTWDDARLAEADSLPWSREYATPATGYYGEMVVARTERELPRTRIEAERRQQARFTFRIAASHVEERRGVRQWRGSVEFAGEALPVLATDSASGARLRELAERARQVSSLSDPQSLPATFRLLPNGRAEVSQQLRLHDGRLLTIRGVRVSDVTVAPFD